MSEKEIATFAGGCFWCMVKPFDEQPGIERWCPAIQEVILRIRLTKKCAVKRPDTEKPFKSHFNLTFIRTKSLSSCFGADRPD